MFGLPGVADSNTDPYNETRSWIRGEFATLLARSSSRALPKVRAGPPVRWLGVGGEGWRKHPIRCVFPWESDQFQWYSCAGKLFSWFDASKHLEMFMSSVGFSCQNWFKPFPSLVPFGKLLKPFPVFPSKDSPFPLHFPVFSWLFNFICGKEQGEQIEIKISQLSEQQSYPNPSITKILAPTLLAPKKTNLSLGSTSPQDQDSIVSITEVQDQFHPLTFGAPGQRNGILARRCGIRGSCFEQHFWDCKNMGVNTWLHLMLLIFIFSPNFFLWNKSTCPTNSLFETTQWWCI